MVWTDLFRDTMRTLFAHKLRTLLTMFGIAWGIVSITLMVAAGEGLRVGPGEGGRELRQGRDDRLRRAAPACRRAGCAPGAACSGRRPTTSRSQQQAPVLRLRDAGARAGRSRCAARYNSASLTDHRLAAGLRRRSARSRWPRAATRTGTTSGRCGGWRSSGSDAKKQLFGSRPALGETIRVGDFPYTVVGRHGAQGAGLELRRARHRQGLRALQRDPARLPEQAAGAARTRSTGCSSRRARSADHEACKGELRRALGRIHDFDPRDEEAAAHLGHGRGGARPSAR